MPFALWHSLVEGVQAALETKTAIEQAQRTDRGRPFAIAGSGLVMCFALGAFLQSTTVMAAATIPPALVAWWGGPQGVGNSGRIVARPWRRGWFALARVASSTS
jgi:hypothetical protein